MNKGLMWIVGLAIVIVLLWVVFRGGDAQTDIDATPTASTSESPIASESPATSPTATARPGTTAKPTVPPAALSYADAVAKYAGFRMQFDAQCQATPNKLVVKNNQNIMLDNRSGDARTFEAGGKTYTLKGYGWMILPMKAPTAARPATVTIGCGSANNVATVIISS